MTPADAALAATVIICTRNRAESLARTLSSIVVAAEGVTAPWELLIVDNGSTDATAQTVRSFADRLPIRSIFHPVAGLSEARNAGLCDARGRFIVWTDDDVLVDGGWLKAYLAAFEAHPEVGIFGGRAVPRYEAPVNEWFVKHERELEGLLALRDCPEWIEITMDRTPYGLNYAVRTDVQRAHTYDTALGVAPGRRIGGEETAMVHAALTAGAIGRWVWDATVYHQITRGRQTRRYVFQYYRAVGYIKPRLPLSQRITTRTLALTMGLGRIVQAGGSMLLARATGRTDWLPSYIKLARAIGSIDRVSARSD